MKSVNATSAHLEKAVDEPSDAVERGRRLQEDERQLTAWQTARLYPGAVLYCSVAFTAGLMYGYDLVVNGSVIAMPSFIIRFGTTGASGIYLPTVWTSLWTSMTSLAQALGAYVVGLVADRWGRKWPGAAAGMLSLVGTAVLYTAETRGWLLAGKMITGAAIGAGMAAGTSYASEVAPLKLAGPMQASLVLFVVFMQGVGLGLVRIFWAVGFLAFVGFALTPESPVYLIRRGKVEQAKKVLGRIYSMQSNAEDRIAYLVQTMVEEQSQTSDEAASYLDCFRGTNLKRTLTVAFLYSTNNWVGGAFLAQSTYFLLTVGLPAVHCFDIGIGGFGLAIIVIVFLANFGHKVSKRRWLLSGIVLNFLFMITIGALYWAPGMGAVWAIGILMNILISIQTSLLQAIGWPIAAQISSYRLRAKTLSIGVLSQTLSTWLTQFIVPYMYNTGSGNLGAKTAFPFAGLSVLVFICAYYCVPNTTGLTTEEIDRLYADKVPVKKFGAFMPETSLE
ncbi:general substrate transporter [Aspergillus heterothallicus]